MANSSFFANNPTPDEIKDLDTLVAETAALAQSIVDDVDLAEDSALAAATSAANAALSASNAAASEAVVTASETNAALSASAAAGSASAASSSASAASVSASNALASKNAAAVSETNAAASAGSASTSATNAAASAAAAATFDPALYATLAGANAFDTRPTFGGNDPWDEGNFDPADYYTKAEDNARYTRRNRIVNGAMLISQENGTSPVTADGAFIADQWTLNRSSSSTITALSGRAASPSDIAAALGVSASPAETSAAAGEFVLFMQAIEASSLVDFKWGSGAALAAVVAFHVNLPVAGTYWVGITNSASTHSFLASYTISSGEVGTWVRKQIVVPAGAINAGVWPVGSVRGAFIRWCFHCGSSNTGVAGFQTGSVLAGPGQALGLSTAGSCYLSNVGLYLDEDNTGIPPKWEMPDEAEELRACQRYYFKDDTASGQMLYPYFNDLQYRMLNYTLPVVMRNAPAVSATFVNGGAGPVLSGRPSWIYVFSGSGVVASSACNLTSLIANARM
jgi:hypothetical protein